LVTGASSGIGEAAAKRLAKLGAHVALVSENGSELERVASEIRHSGGEAEPFVADFSRPDEVSGLVERIEAAMGPLEALVNNAGIGYGAAILNTPPDAIRRLFEVNFFSMADLSRQALTSMQARRRGRIVNVSSAAGLFGCPGIAAYSATKGAMHAFTQALRVEAAEYNVQVTEVIPISVQTPFFSNVGGDKYAPAGLTITADAVARSIAGAVVAPGAAVEALPYRPLRLFLALNAALPALFARLEISHQRRMRRSAARSTEGPVN
jgi:3-oxoacyl-[acyl-carrier protein] reductase